MASVTSTLTTPRSSVATPSVATLPAAMTAVSGAPVLIVEADDGMRTMLSTVLTEAGFEVLPTADGLEALAAIKLLDSQPLGVILLDATLPVMDAAGFLRAYRQQAGPHAPAIVLTDLDPEHFNAPTGPVAAVLTKPVAFDELLALVRRYTQPKPDTGDTPSLRISCLRRRHERHQCHGRHEYWWRESGRPRRPAGTAAACGA